MVTEPAWLPIARKYIGFHEQSGNRGIEEFIRLAHTGQVGDAWCAIFANACLESVGLRGSRSAAARSFENNPNFTRLTTPRVGAIVTFWRGSPSSGQGHVGFLVSDEGKSIQVLGGNQNDQVCIEPQSTAHVTGYWWPVGEADIYAGGHQTTRQVGITATVFGGVGDPNNSAYDGHRITDQELGVSLPYRFPKGSHMDRLKVIRGDKSIICDLVDVGPWNINDPYWTSGARPQAETGTDKTGRKTNRAGIDLTPAAARALGIDGKGLVDWEFVMDDQATTQPPASLPPAPQLPLPPALPGAGRFDLGAFFRYLVDHRDEAAQILRFGVGIYNSMHPERPLALPSAAPPPPPPAASTTTPAMQRPSVQVSVIGGIAGAILQALGIVGMPVGDGATQTGLLTTIIPIATAVLGATGGFGSIASVLLKIVGGFVKK